MHEWTSGLPDWSARGIGAVAGSSISLVYLVPKQRREAMSRLIVGVVIGIVFGAATGEKLVQIFDLTGHVSRTEILLMGASTASFVSWWVLGLVSRFFDKTTLSQKNSSQKDDRS